MSLGFDKVQKSIVVVSFSSPSLLSSIIDIKRKNRLLKVCYVPTTSATFLAFFPFLLLWPFIVLMKQTRQAVCAFKQSI